MRWLALIFVVIASSSLAQAQTAPLGIPGQATEVSPAAEPLPSQVQYIPPQPNRLFYSVVIENRTGGVIRVVDPPAQFLLSRPGDDIGTVLKPASALILAPCPSPRGQQGQQVSGSAVHGLRLTLTPRDVNGEAGVLEVLPVERHFQAPDGSFEQPRPAAIYTDIAAGHGIFGGSYPLVSGNPVGVHRQGQPVYFDDGGMSLAVGDIIIIEVRGPGDAQTGTGWPLRLEVENHAGGTAMLYATHDAAEHVGAVAQALGGGWRCPGQAYCQPGSIREASRGLIELACLPTSPLRVLRLEPYHFPAGATVEDTPPLLLTTGGGDDPWGEAPCFLKYLYPQSGYEAPRLLPRLRVSVQITGAGEWVPLSAIVVPEVLAQIAAFRFEWLEHDADATAAQASLPDSVPAPSPDTPSLRN